MDFYFLFLLALGVGADAFTVSLVKGLAMKTVTIKQALIVGLWFGSFQGLMPLFGYLLGEAFAPFFDAFADWIAFFLLTIIGANMIKEALSDEEDADTTDADADASLAPSKMIIPAIATSIDAFAVGISLAFKSFDIVPAVLLIGIVTCVLCMIGVKLGSVYGSKFKSNSELVGGAILILLGTKILLQHFGIL